nr:MAG TPA: transcription factor IIS-like protein [Caudoviricetes sp.]
MKEGWICPRCGRVNAPFIGQCTCKSNNLSMSNLEVDCIHDWDFDSISSNTGGIMYKYHCAKCGKSITTEVPMASIKI